MPLPTFYLLADNKPKKDAEKKPGPKKPPKLPKKPGAARKDPKESEEQNADKPKTLMIVGVDFGTTFSGFATAMETSSFEGLKLNRTWPGAAGHQDKVPSLLEYAADNSGKLKAWGYKAKASDQTFAWFKLGLGKDQKPNENDDDLLHQEGMGSIKCPEGMKFSDLATDYLCEFYKHILKAIEKDNLDSFDNIAFRFVLAVPAGWPNADCERIKSCALKAGFGTRMQDKVLIITEPEAGALASFYSYESKYKGTGTFKRDTNVMVIDMGGGTVDLITYTIKTPKHFKVDEACPGSSAKCGSTTIDRHFLEFMKERFGEEFTKKPAKEIGPESRFMKDFETLKRTFDGITDPDHIHLSMDWSNKEEYNAEDGQVCLTREDVEGFFKPVIENVIGLIKEQVQGTKDENKLPITAIMLCGGLAENEYIREELKKFCKDNLPGVKVVVSENPWAAICHGAAMSGTKSNSIIDSRKARRSYGAVEYVPFEEGDHDEKTAFIHPNGQKKAQKMHWHIKRNDKLSSKGNYRWLNDVAIQIGGHYGYKGEIEVFQSENTSPPLWKTDKGVAKLGVLTVDLSGIPPPKKQKCSSSTSSVPSWAQKIKVGQKILPQTGSVEFIARVGNNGNVGTATFAYAPKDDDEEEVEEGDDRDHWRHRPFMNNTPPGYRNDDDDDSDDDEDSSEDDEDA